MRNRKGFVGRLFDQDGPLRIADGRSHREEAFPPSVIKLLRLGGLRVLPECGRQFLLPRRRRFAGCDQPLVVWISMREQLGLLVHQEGVALVADLDAVDSTPELFERQLGDNPPRILSSASQRYRNSGRGQAVGIDVGNVDVERGLLLRRRGFGAGYRQRRLGNAASRHDATAAIEHGDLPELVEVENVIAEDPFPLPLIELRSANLGRN